MSFSSSPLPLAASLSDRDLERRNRQFGFLSRRAEQRFLATFPEIARRGLAEAHGGLFALAARRGGVKPSKVQNILELARRLEPFPRIWALVERGEAGYSVVGRVPLEFLRENEGAWEEILRSHSRRQVDTVVKEERARRRTPGPHVAAQSPEASTARPSEASADLRGSMEEQLPGQEFLPWGGSSDGSAPPPPLEGEPNPLAGQAENQDPERTHRVVVFLTPDEAARLRVACRERSRARGKPVSQGDALREAFLENFLDTRPPGESPASPEERRELHERAIAAAEGATGKAAPIDVQRDVGVRSEGVCERPGCGEAGEHLHHQIPYRARRGRLGSRLRGLPRHHPDAVVLLCGTCHALVHEGRIENPEDPVGRWRVAPVDGRQEGTPQDQRYRVERARARTRVTETDVGKDRAA